MVDVFISYKREERARCERIYHKLRALDLDVWFDARLTAGQSFDREIKAAVNAAKAVLVLWSPLSVESDWVLEEAGVGKKRGVLAAAQLSPCEAPFGFSRTHYVVLHDEAFADNEPGWLKLLERIGVLTERTALASYSRALGQAASPLLAWIKANQDDPLADRMRERIHRLEAADVQGPPIPLHSEPISRTRDAGPEAVWSRIEHSLDPRDYDDFLDVFPGSGHVFEARLHRRKIDDWSHVEKSDPAGVHPWSETRKLGTVLAEENRWPKWNDEASAVSSS